MNTRCLIVDDEPLARKVIKSHLKDFSEIEIVGECENALQATELLRKETIDLIFLDIEMPKITGFDFLKSVKNPPKIIVVTAYRNYALKSYEYDVVDYLLKPVSFERFYKAVNKYFKQSEQTGLEVMTEEKSSDSNTFIYLNEDKTIYKLFLKDILYIESYREYIKVHTEEKSVLTKMSISKIEEQLREYDFIRIHKSFVASVSKVNAFNARTIFIADQELPIGRTYKNEVMKTLKFDEDLL
ncbi:MAG: response regulator transcription factor [Bacteroidota bacterium]|nr:response regulator transcription factor [Bacteroidota bacterium]